METLGYILGLVGYIWIWDSKLKDSIFLKDNIVNNVVIGKIYRSALFGYLDNSIIGKLMSCGTCLSGWAGIVLYLLTFNIFFLSLPIAYKLLTK